MASRARHRRVALGVKKTHPEAPGDRGLPCGLICSRHMCHWRPSVGIWLMEFDDSLVQLSRWLDGASPTLITDYKNA